MMFHVSPSIRLLALGGLVLAFAGACALPSSGTSAKGPIAIEAEDVVKVAQGKITATPPPVIAAGGANVIAAGGANVIAGGTNKPASSAGAAASGTTPSEPSTPTTPSTATSFSAVLKTTSFNVIPVSDPASTTASVSRLLFSPSSGVASWDVTAPAGEAVTLGKVKMTFLRTIKTVQPAAPAGAATPAAPTEPGLGGTTVQEKGTPKVFDLTATDLGWPATLNGGEVKTLDVSFDNARTLTFVKGEAGLKEFTVTIELFDGAGAALKGSGGTPLTLNLKAAIL